MHEWPPAVRTFRVRRYECDAYGHVNNTTYLRYLEEAEYEAGLTAHGDVGMRIIDIEFLIPLTFGDEVTVTASTSAFSPLLRSYELVSSPGDPAARASVTWGPADPGLWGLVPQPPPPAPAVFAQSRTVEWRDVDQSARVSPATLAAFAEDCGVDLCAAYGWPMERCTGAGFAMVLRRHQIECRDPLTLGDEFRVSTWASDLRRTTAIRHYLIDSGGKHAARFRSQYVWVDLDSGRPIRIPKGFLDDFRPNFAAPG